MKNKKNKERYGGVILVDGGEGYIDTSLAMAKRLLRNMGAEYKDLVYFSGTVNVNMRSKQIEIFQLQEPRKSCM